jgi:hypothetical protein
MVAVCGSWVMRYSYRGMTRVFRTGVERMRDVGNGGGRRDCRCYFQGDKRVTKGRKEGAEEKGGKRVMHKKKIDGSGRRYPNEKLMR